ncbi:hypothetical protein [Devosia sp.]|uniref:hypothetical protein n=1 Tax=Devosia sp. TaxID=1871048 RepID=UPI003263C923
MTLFDRYIAVDWSANNSPKSGRDSIWIAEANSAGVLEISQNPRTRHAAMATIVERLERALVAGQRVLIGFDFPFGYPAGVAEKLGGSDQWHSLWALLAREVEDAPDNLSNRFEVAARFNTRLSAQGAQFWGCPTGHSREFLSARKIGNRFDALPEFRQVERHAKGAKTLWQLYYAGSVGSQAMLGIARLEALRHHPTLGPNIAIWPFQTHFNQRLDAPIVIAEIYPSLIKQLEQGMVKDRAQVEAQVRLFARLDRNGSLHRALGASASLNAAEHEIAVTEEGWIVGVGHLDLPSAAGAMAA